MKKPALGKPFKQVDEENQGTFEFPPAYKPHGPETSHIAEEEMTASGKRERHCHAILSAMHRLKATEKRPVTGAQIAEECGLVFVEVMRRLRTDLEKYGSGIIGCTDKKMFCELTHKQLLGWFLKE